MAKACLAPCVADTLSLLRLQMGGQGQTLGQKRHAGTLSQDVSSLACFSPMRRPADSERELLMRAKLAHRDSQLTAKVGVVTRAYTGISERNVVLRQMKTSRRHTGNMPSIFKRHRREFNNLFSAFTHQHTRTYTASAERERALYHSSAGARPGALIF